jgi:hypothetical protein
MGKAGTGGRIGNANDVLAGGALNLPAGILRLAFQRLIAMGTIKLEFIRWHRRCND